MTAAAIAQAVPVGLASLARRPLTAAGLAIVMAMVALAILAPVLPLPDPDATAPAQRLLPPFSGHGVLGTDGLGRDVLARVVWGLRISLLVGAAATLAAAAAGSAIGLFAAFYGGRVDGVLMRLIDVLMAFPYLLLALAIVAALGPGLENAALAIAIANVPFFARSVRGAALGVVGRDFVDAARMAGLSDARILLSEILPNVAPLIAVATGTTIGWMILETAGLSFLGLGAQPPQADLGSMLGEGRKVFASAPHVAAAAGVATFILAIGLNLLGDGVRDWLDPRLGDGPAGAPAAATAVALTSPRRGEVVRRSRAGEGDQGFPERAEAPHPALRADLSPQGRGEEPRRPLERSQDQFSSEPPLLAVERLVVAIQDRSGLKPAVRDVNLALRPGEALGIVGESGSGKSVTALSLTRLAASPPFVVAGGAVGFEGRDLLGEPFEVLRGLRGADVAYVFQDPSTTLNPLMRVGAQIEEAVRSGDRRARARALAEAVRLPDPDRVLAAYPHELSGGQRQRVVIAMALANDPKILIADEPTTALDATTQAEVLELFLDLVLERGAALIFVSHDLPLVARLCERVAVMYAGEIVEEGPSAEVLNRPRHPYAARLVACAPRLGRPDEPLDAIPGAPPPLAGRREGCAFAPRCRLAIDACREGPIAMTAVGENHVARCIRTRETAHG